jgi:hypothetical protein
MTYEEIIQTFPILKEISNYLGVSIEVAIALFAIMLIWEIIWSGMALFKSAKNNHKIWFVILLLFHTWGILDILYIYVFSDLMNNFNKNKLMNPKLNNKLKVSKAQKIKKKSKRK